MSDFTVIVCIFRVDARVLVGALRARPRSAIATYKSVVVVEALRTPNAAREQCPSRIHVNRRDVLGT